MSFIKAMLAKKMPEDFNPIQGAYLAEEKYDGIRIVTEVSKGAAVTWSRYQKLHMVPLQVGDALQTLPDGVYDGELYAPGKRSYGTADLDNSDIVIYAVFDVMELLGRSTLSLDQVNRRILLHDIFKTRQLGAVHMSPAWPVDSMEDIYRLRDEVWARDGEGLILKRKAGLYAPGKRSKDWMKVKKLQQATLTVTGFKPGTGSIIDTGPYAIAVLLDDEDNETRVKVLDDATRAELQRAAQLAGESRHPYIGRRLCIEYQERTPDGSYRHPRWDRWENE